jgi:pimeloyl-ACP methyl ester carboxylesterase
MRLETRKLRPAFAVAAIGLSLALVAASPAAARTTFNYMPGFDDPATPDNLDRVGVLKVGPQNARNVLVLNPGTSASAAYFRPLADFIVDETDGWQVWAVERRENQLEDQSVFDQAKSGQVSTQRMFDYYLGYLTDPSITDHFENIPDADVAFARGWGMNVEIQDLRRVVEAAQQRGGDVVVGGHSLGGSITSAYATWDFGGEPGAKGLSGLVFIDGGSDPTPITTDEANQDLQDLQAGSPWLSFGGIPAPLAGLFNTIASTGTHLEPNGVGALQTWPLLPSNLRPPVLATNQGGYGFALDNDTSPESLIAAQAHLGHLADSGSPRPWVDDEITPIDRYTRMFSGTGLEGLDGTAWYHPQRLTIDSGAVAAGNPNPAQQVLDVHATHGDDLPRGLRLYAFGAQLGGQRVLDAATVLANQSGIPRKNVKLVKRESTYSHNDPNSAFPKNVFVKNLVKFLAKIQR